MYSQLGTVDDKMYGADTKLLSVKSGTVDDKMFGADTKLLSV